MIFQSARQRFNDKELVDLTIEIIAINGWNRLAIPFRTTAGIRSSSHSSQAGAGYGVIRIIYSWKENKMADPAQDRSVVAHIQRLAAEEHQLFEQESLHGADKKHPASLQVELNQCWDLLRQRQTRRDFGEDPNEAQVCASGAVANHEG